VICRLTRNFNKNNGAKVAKILPMSYLLKKIEHKNVTDSIRNRWKIAIFVELFGNSISGSVQG